MVIAAHGIRVDLPDGWEGRIYRRPEGDPTLHAGTFALPHDDGDFGTAAIESMPPGASFIALTEYRPGAGLEPGRGLFAAGGPPLPVERSHFRPNALHVTLPGRSGFQHFFSAAARPFCLYAVVRAAHRRAHVAAAQATAIDGVLRTLVISQVAAPE